MSARVHVPSTDPASLAGLKVGDLVQVDGLLFAEPRTWGGHVERIDSDEYGLYLRLREPIEWAEGYFWESHADTGTSRITVVGPDQLGRVLRSNFLPRKRPPFTPAGYGCQRYHHGFPLHGQWAGHRVGYWRGRHDGDYLWGDCVSEWDGDLIVMFDGDATVYSFWAGDVFVCEHATPCTAANYRDRGW